MFKKIIQWFLVTVFAGNYSVCFVYSKDIKKMADDAVFLHVRVSTILENVLKWSFPGLENHGN